MSEDRKINGPLPGSKSRGGFSPGLYLVSTPIGNARDITLRALDLLASADRLYAEDTRVTAKLLALHGIRRSTTAYHEHSAERVEREILAHLERGDVVAIVSDAGTPLVSDPGTRLVQAAVEAGHQVVPIPGASAVLAALTASGLVGDRFLFAGFLPSKANERRRAITEVAGVPATLVFFDSPNRVAASLQDLAALLPGRSAAVARELTKLHEEIKRGTLDELAAGFGSSDAPKGEIVIVVGPPSADAPRATPQDQLDRRLKEEIARRPVKEAAAIVAAELGLQRRLVYARALEIKD